MCEQDILVFKVMLISYYTRKLIIQIYLAVGNVFLA